MGLFGFWGQHIPGFWRQHIPGLEGLLWPMYQVTQSVASFEWAQHKKKFCGGSRLLCHLDRVIQQIQWCLNYQAEVLFIDFCQAPTCESGQNLRILEQSLVIVY